MKKTCESEGMEGGSWLPVAEIEVEKIRFKLGEYINTGILNDMNFENENGIRKS